jgi:hypothetical protein
MSKVFDEKVYSKRERKEVFRVGGNLIRQCVEWEVYRIFFRTLLSIRRISMGKKVL